MKSESTIQRILWGVCLLFTLALSSCGGGGSSSGAAPSNTTETGVFLDSAVEGISYISGSVSGITDANGTFTYEVGSVVRFMIGDVVIGEAPGQSVITPVDLVSGSDASHPTVINIVCFLLTLDEDGNPDNGIQISETIRNLAQGKSIDFAQATVAFAADGNVQTVVSEFTAVTVAGARSLVTESYAQTHLSGTIWGIYAGSYSGTFSGGDIGSLSVTILSDGSVIGTGTFDSVGAFTVSGQLVTNGVLVFAMDGTPTGASFTGTIGMDGTMIGSWGNAGATGAFTGQRSSMDSGDDTGGDTSGTYGSLTITGEGPLVGTSFTPDVGAGAWLAPGYFRGQWGEWVDDSGVYFQIMISDLHPHEIYYIYSSAYYLCTPDGCSGVTHDTSARTITFSNIELQRNESGAVITINGTLNYVIP